MHYIFQKRCLIWIWTPLLKLSLLSCTDLHYDSPEGYNLEDFNEKKLGKPLKEISGIQYNQEPRTLLAISDRKQNLIEIDLDAGKLRDFTPDMLGEKMDYEDIVLLDSTIYVLSGKGIIREFNRSCRDSSCVKTHALPLTGVNDFESLYFDPATNSLVMICKSCEADKKQNRVSAFRFDLGNKTFDTAAWFTLDTRRVRQLAKNDGLKFHPSAAAVHPLEKQLYILASSDQLLVIADLKGQIQKVYPLHPDYFPQAEGICFAPNGTMFISNEGKYGQATIKLFQYKEAGRNRVTDTLLAKENSNKRRD
ncbi:MAG TPA: SdiA-regulated domain-containing protein [Chitinophagaceae bacterium]|nr:SdiA-regulated domain-containing protein [Chitinophagaceae bacterium]